MGRPPLDRAAPTARIGRRSRSQTWRRSKSLQCSIARRLQLGAYHRSVTRNERDETPVVRSFGSSAATVGVRSSFGNSVGFGRVKRFRRVSTRYGKLVASFLVFVSLAAAVDWLTFRFRRHALGKLRRGGGAVRYPDTSHEELGPRMVPGSRKLAPKSLRRASVLGMPSEFLPNPESPVCQNCR